MNVERYEYDEEGDVLDVYFTEAQFAQRPPVWTIELTPNIMISIDRAARQAVQLTLLDYSVLVRITDGGPISFPITGLADLPKAERQLVLTILTALPVNRWLDISTVQLLPDSPFTVTHLEPPPQALKSLVPMLA
ncbi:MAG: DUF2283 domain-containing protein [Caldilineaceae bacterium]|nr:DUF2283 domain-containing protein [Caldilineaceae bacterium]